MAEGGTDSLYRTEQRIRIISTSEEANQVIKAHVASEPVIGFDCEWNSRSEQSERIALVQIATRQHVFLLRLFKMAQMPAELVTLLRNRNVLKVGVNIEVDKKKLQQQRGCIVEGIVDLRSLAFNSPSYGQVLFQQLQVLNMKIYGMAEADQISKKATWMPKMGLGPMVQDCLGVALNKSGTARWQDDWEVEVLAPNQVEYAAGDAASALEIFYAFLSKRRLGCRVDVTKEIVDRTTVEELVKGLVDIPPSKKNKAIKQRALDCVLRIEPTFNITPYYYKPQDAQQSGMRLESARPPRIREPREIPEPRHYQISGKIPYDNCRLLAPDDTLLCTCSLKKAQWYLTNCLADPIPESDPLAVRLRFEPSGRPVDESDFYCQEKENVCCSCGSPSRLVRKNVVPREYRKHLPASYKDKQCHDVVLLCARCHCTSNMNDMVMRERLAREHEVPVNIETATRTVDRRGMAVKSAARALTGRGAGKIPVGRQEELRGVVAEWLGHPPSGEELMECREMKVEERRSGLEHGAEVVRRVVEGGGEGVFVRRWRQFFVDTMRPAQLPVGWSVDHRPRDCL